MNILAIFTMKNGHSLTTAKALREVGHEVTPIDIYATAKKLNPLDLYNEFSALWDYLFKNNRFDAVLCYHLPDELLLRKCREHNLRLLVEENYGHVPEKCHAIFPFYADFEKYYGTSEIIEIPPESERPRVVIPLEYHIYYFSKFNTIESYLYTDDISRVAHWKEEKELSSHYYFSAFMLELIEEYKLYEYCDFYFRPHPRPKYKGSFDHTLKFLTGKKLPYIKIDEAPVVDSLKATDIVVAMMSSFGFDSLQYGADVIYYKHKAHYTNPLYAKIPETPDALAKTIIASVENYHNKGKQKRKYIDQHLQALRSTFYAPVVPAPEEILKHSTRAVENCMDVPILPEWSLK